MSAYEPTYPNQQQQSAYGQQQQQQPGYYNNTPAYTGGAYETAYQQPPPQQYQQPPPQAPTRPQPYQEPAAAAHPDYYQTPPPASQPQPTHTSTTGGSYAVPADVNFGDEPEAKLKCNDPVCAIFFLIVFIGTIGLFGWSVHTYLNSPILYYTYSYHINTGFVGILLGSCGLAILTGFLLLMLLRRFPGKMIRFSIYVMFVLYVGFAVFLFIQGAILAGVLLVLGALMLLLWRFCARKRIKFAEKVLKYSIQAIQKSWGVFIVTAIETIITALYTVWWVIGTLYLISIVFNNKATADGYDAASNQGVVYVLLYIALAFCLFLVGETFSNVVHVTTCGVVGSHWFSPQGTHKYPTWASFKRASIWSLGSVVFGSLLVSFLRTLRLMIMSFSDGFCGAIAGCLLACLESLIRFFNTYAFAHVALYGDSYCTAAKNTMEMFKSKGFTVIINDQLISIVLTVSSLIGGIVSCAVCGSIYYFAIDGDNLAPFFFCFICGYFVCGIIMTQVHSAAVATVVVWASDPAAIQQNYPEVYAKLEKARSKF